MAQAGFTPIQLYRTTTASAQPSAGNLAAGELAINLTDKKLYAKDASNNVFLLADASSGGTTAANLAGGAAGSLPYQSGANATTFLGIGAANRVLTSSGSAPQWVTSLTGLTGVSSSSITNTSLTATRLVYSTTGGAQTDSANLTFDGTSLTLGGNPTLSAGTANGVLYLNGSKVATSGTDLVFSGTNGFITSGGGAFQGATAPSSGAGIEMSYGALAGIGRILGYNRTGAARVPIVIDGSYVAGYADGTEGMRLTSTGLGIGTSSPAGSLHVNKAGYVICENSAFGQTPSNAGLSIGYNRSGANGESSLIWGAPASGFNFEICSYASSTITPRLTIDSSGNLGLGGTPSAWGGGYTGFQVRNSFSLWAASGTSAYLSRNVFYDGTSRKYVFTGAAAEYEMGAGVHTWFTAPSGTAGNTISFTQAMTLTSGGALLVGTQSALNNGTVEAYAASRNGFVAQVTNNVNSLFQGFDSSNNVAFQVTGGSVLSVNNIYALGTTNPLIFGTNSQERARVDTNGNLLVGTQSAELGSGFGNIQIQGSSGAIVQAQTGAGTVKCAISTDSSSGYSGTRTNHPLLFITNNTERARIPAAGGMVVGTAALATSATDGFLYVPTCAGTPTGTPTTQTGTAPIVVDTTNNKLYFYSGGQWRDAGP